MLRLGVPEPEAGETIVLLSVIFLKHSRPGRRSFEIRPTEALS